MSWKDLPYWLKGAIIGFLIGLILAGIIHFTSSPSSAGWDSLGFVIVSLPAFLVILPFMFLFDQIMTRVFGIVLNDDITIWYYGIFGWILFGALIGGIIGKIKSKKKEL